LWHAPGLAQLTWKMGMMSLLKDIVEGHTMAAEPEEPLAVPVPEPEPVELPEAMPELEPEPEPEPLPTGGGLPSPVEEQATATEAQAVRKRREKTLRGIEKPSFQLQP
jgi:hypothetical protein